MDPKVLLMPVYSRGNEIERLRGALSLARYFGAHLTVLHAQARPSQLLDNELFALSPKMRARMVSIMDQGADQDQKELFEHFKALCAQADVAISDDPSDHQPTASWREISGARSELVAVQGRVSDLIIIPHSKDGNATLTFEEAVLHTGRPVLLVPRGMWEFKLTNILIGWDGGLEVSRALHHAMPFLARAESVTLAASPDKLDVMPDMEVARNFLTFHGIAARVETLDPSASSPGAGLLARAAERDCDFLVTGAYAHTRLRQSILGGVTQHLLKHAEIPVLMAH